MKKQVIALAGLWVVSMGGAAADLRSCASIEDRDKRLACFDALAASSKPAPVQWGTPVSRANEAAAATPAAAAVKAVPDSFGLSPRVSANELRSRIKGLVDSWEADTVFELENGQQWRVADGSSAYLNLRDPDVVIKASALGGFRMEIAGSNKVVRVRRIR